jgi:hypothetical protein
MFLPLIFHILAPDYDILLHNWSYLKLFQTSATYTLSHRLAGHKVIRTIY